MLLFELELTLTALVLPELPLPLFEMCETIDAEERNRAVVLVAVVRVEVYSNVAVKVL